jgi:hypothetical protein
MQGHDTAPRAHGGKAVKAAMQEVFQISDTAVVAWIKDQFNWAII